VLAQEVDKRPVDWQNKCTGRPKKKWTNKVTLVEYIVVETGSIGGLNSPSRGRLNYLVKSEKRKLFSEKYFPEPTELLRLQWYP